MKNWKFAAFLLLVLSSGAHAGVVQGTVKKLIQRASDGLAYVEIDGTLSAARPACATAVFWTIADENSDAGKKQFAMLMTAHATGAVVLIRGKNTCARWPDAEDINEVVLLN